MPGGERKAGRPEAGGGARPILVVDALRKRRGGALAVSWPALGLAAALAAADIVLAGWLFARVYRHAVRTGLLARYSAETVS